MNKMQAFLFPILAFTALLCLPHCAIYHPEATQPEGRKSPAPPPPPPPVPPPPDRPIFLWVTNCAVAGDMDRARHQAWEMRPAPNSCVGSILVNEPCPGTADADGRDAADDICAGSYTGILFNPCTMADMDVGSAIVDTQRTNIEANVPSNLIHRAVLNTDETDLDANNIISMGPDREQRTVRRPDNTPIADNWNDFFDASGNTRANITGASASDYWTGISSGPSFSGSTNNCGNVLGVPWIDSASGNSGIAGNPNQINSTRFNRAPLVACSNLRSLLCASFEGP